MNHNQASDIVQVTTLGSLNTSEAGPSFQRAAILFIASVCFLVGVSLLLASI
jgi:hypothetical protein